MNQPLNDPRHPWARLNAAARQVRDERDASAPYGFATRVAALAFASERNVASLFDLFAPRALGIACLLALGSLALNFHAISSAFSGTHATVASSDEGLLPAADAVAIVLDIAD